MSATVGSGIGVMVGAVWARAREWYESIPPAHRVLLFTAAVVSVTAPLLFLGGSGGPRFRVVLHNVRDADELSQALEELHRLGVDYQVGRDGRSLSVPEDALAQAVKAIRTSRFHGADLDRGYDDLLRGQGSMYMGPELQRLQRSRVLEGEIAKTIMLYDVVGFARVHINKPKRGLFRSSDPEASASIFLELQRGKKLDPRQVDSIVELTANAVEGLRKENVTICDSLGSRYTGTGAGRAGAEPPATPATPEQEVELARILEAALLAKVNATLGRMFGPEGFASSLSVVLDSSVPVGSRRQSRRPRSQTLARRPRTTSGGHDPAPAGPIAASPVSFQVASLGVGFWMPSLQAPPADAPGPASDAGPRSLAGPVASVPAGKGDRVAFMAAPRIGQLALSVLIDGSGLPARTLDPALRENLERHLKTAVGFRQERGDSFVMMTVPFAGRGGHRPAAAPAPASRPVLAWITDHFYLFWGVQLGLLLTVLVALVRHGSSLPAENPGPAMTALPLECMKKRLMPGGLECLENAISRLDVQRLGDRLARMSPAVIAQALRLLSPRGRSRVLGCLAPAPKSQVEEFMGHPVPLRLMERSLGELARGLQEVA